MSSLNNIKAPIKKEIIEFETFFRLSLKSKVPLLNIITNFNRNVQGYTIDYLKNTLCIY